MVEVWHEAFDPARFISMVNVENLIERNRASDDNEVNQIKKPCIMCHRSNSSGLILNDKSFICKSCFEEVSYVRYPEKYEKRERVYLAQVNAREKALNSFIESFGFGLMTEFRSLMEKLIFAESEREKKIRIWKEKYPMPTSPELRHFHDPGAELSQRDLIILKVFNNWPGYPPFWRYLRGVVLLRDNNRCQVSGCPSRLELHVHHKIPLSKGGEHTPGNLIALCNFHHALEPDSGHERIWGKITTSFYTMVRTHNRKNPVSIGSHEVKAHIRRLELIDQDELVEIIEFYGLACPSCGNKRLVVQVDQDVTVNCQTCDVTWIGARSISEETGPRLAEILSITQNNGGWQSRWEMLKERSESVFDILGTENAKTRKRKKQKINGKVIAPKCPDCGLTMRLIKPRQGQNWNKFWGCSNYRSTGCRGSRRY